MSLTRIPLPDRLRTAAEQRGSDPVQPKDAATIVVVRDGDDGIEAYLMRRQSSMKFAAGFYVFPGGGVQADDRDADIPWSGPGADVWAARFGCDVSLARGLVVAAVRETFEETGVLLAGPDADTVLADTSTPDLQQARDDLEERRIGFGDFLSGRGLVLRADLLGAWSHWITPAFEPRRYDTRFFVAALPAGQRVGTISRESDHARWVPLREVLAAITAGEAEMMPPTIATCRQVASLTAATIVAASKDQVIEPIEPRVVEVDGELFLETELGENP